jgi:DNA-binding CsgD family transcriptional regulator
LEDLVGTLAVEQISALVGAIYDCAVDPDRWPEVMGQLAQVCRCMDAALLMLDLEKARFDLFKSWNYDARWIEHADHSVADQYRRAADLYAQPLDEPFASARMEPFRSEPDKPIYTEVAEPLGVCDSIQTIVFRQRERFGLFVTNRHKSVGLVSDEDLDQMRVFAPHVRRAVTISDILDLKMLQTEALATTLDNLASGIMIVGDDNRILHANVAARGMLATGDAIRSNQGRLFAVGAGANDELDAAVVLARRNEAAIGATGIGVALPGRGGEPSVAHVLPLARGDVRTRLMRQATAAVFVTQSARLQPPAIATAAATFGLTPAETRTLEHVMRGATLARAAKALGVANTTVRSHLQSIFAKTGVSRKSELMVLITRLSPQVRVPGGND